MKITLRVFLNEADAGQTLDIDSSYVLIGRENAAVMIADPRCSQQHAMLFEGPDGLLWLKDLRSTNGTWIGDERVGEARLDLGTSIRIGRARVEVLTFEADQDGALTVVHSLIPGTEIAGPTEDGKVLPFDRNRKKTKTQPGTTTVAPNADPKRNAA